MEQNLCYIDSVPVDILVKVETSVGSEHVRPVIVAMVDDATKIIIGLQVTVPKPSDAQKGN